MRLVEQVLGGEVRAQRRERNQALLDRPVVRTSRGSVRVACWGMAAMVATGLVGRLFAAR